MHISFVRIIIIIPFRVFTTVLADGLSLEFERQQVFSRLQNSSQYSGRSQQCRSLDDLHSFFIFKSSSPCINPLVTVPNAPVTIGISVTFMFRSFFNFQARSSVIIIIIIPFKRFVTALADVFSLKSE